MKKLISIGTLYITFIGILALFSVNETASACEATSGGWTYSCDEKTLDRCEFDVDGTVYLCRGNYSEVRAGWG